jgi:formylglycine-generating enzyme required for sulfatase activity
MSGNVWEWCDDWSGSIGSNRILPGGSWDDSAGSIRVGDVADNPAGSRNIYDGLRPARTAQ